jgi:hypothetical protein
MGCRHPEDGAGGMISGHPDQREMSDNGQTTSVSWWRTPLIHLATRLHEREDQVFLVLALVTGALTGLVVVAFILLTERAGMRLDPMGPGGGANTPVVSLRRIESWYG